MSRIHPLNVLICLTGLSLGPVQADSGSLTLETAEGRFRVLVEGELFAELDCRTYAKPIVYPILGPGQVPMTRNFPMVRGVAGEATDHPHHKSMWFAHGDVNGVSFWDERGRIVNEQVVEIREDAERPSVTLLNQYLAPTGQQVCRERLTIAFSVAPGARIIDWDVTLLAEGHEVRLGDTKEGTMALRVHPHLRLENDARQGVTEANGKALNSEGVSGPEVWGKRARWVDYSGRINGRPAGIAFLDHPQNLRHPTYWHARAYGLFAANPFGVSDFVGEGQDGSHTIPAGESLRLRYRLVFHAGEADAARVEAWYRTYASATGGPQP